MVPKVSIRPGLVHAHLPAARQSCSDCLSRPPKHIHKAWLSALPNGLFLCLQHKSPEFKYLSIHKVFPTVRTVKRVVYCNISFGKTFIPPLEIGQLLVLKTVHNYQGHFTGGENTGHLQYCLVLVFHIHGHM